MGFLHDMAIRSQTKTACRELLKRLNGMVPNFNDTEQVKTALWMTLIGIVESEEFKILYPTWMPPLRLEELDQSGQFFLIVAMTVIATYRQTRHRYQGGLYAKWEPSPMDVEVMRAACKKEMVKLAR